MTPHRQPPGFALDLAGAVELATTVVTRRVPSARAAWLGGSVVWGGARAGSDLDVTVLADRCYRESLVQNNIPLEIFVHTDQSLAGSLALHRERRSPVLLKLIGHSVLLVDRDGTGEHLMTTCHSELAAGPEPLRGNEIDALRYVVTADLEDLERADDPAVHQIIATRLYQRSAELLCGLDNAWFWDGKRLPAWLSDNDQRNGGTAGARLTDAFRHVNTNVHDLIRVVDELLNRCGGRLFDGYHADTSA